MLLIFWIWLSQFVCLVGRICGVRAHFQPNSVASTKIRLSRISAENMVQPAEFFLKNLAEGSSLQLCSHRRCGPGKTVSVVSSMSAVWTSHCEPWADTGQGQRECPWDRAHLPCEFVKVKASGSRVLLMVQVSYCGKFLAEVTRRIRTLLRPILSIWSAHTTHGCRSRRNVPTSCLTLCLAAGRWFALILLSLRV